MAIITQTILTTDEYLEVYKADSSVETDVIESAINDATITLDAVCGGMIAKVWPVIDPTDPNYRTAEEKNYIKQAHAIQAHEGVSRSLDFTGGSESYTSGSNNYNQSRTTPNIVADEIIYQLLAKARVYNPNITTDTTISGGQGDRLYDPTYDPSQEYITIELGDNRYVHKHAESEDYKNKFLYYDENGNITYVELSEIILENYYTKEQIDAKLLAYITEAQVDAKLENYYNADEIDELFGNYYNKTEIDGKFADYYTTSQVDAKLENYYNADEIDELFGNYYNKTEIDGKFADYYTTSQVDALLNDKQNRLTAGENITIAQVGQDLVISATTEPIGSVDFADIVGDPYDNAELSMVLNAKASASDLTTETLARSNADTALGNRITATETDIESLETQVGQLTPVITEITAHTTINTYEVPSLTTAQVQSLYNSVVAGRTTIIHFNPSGLDITTDYTITQASNVSGIAIRFVYNDVMILTYTINGDDVEIIYKDIGGEEQPRLYRHHVHFTFVGSTGEIEFVIDNNTTTPFTEETFYNLIGHYGWYGDQSGSVKHPTYLQVLKLSEAQPKIENDDGYTQYALVEWEDEDKSYHLTQGSQRFRLKILTKKLYYDNFGIGVEGQEWPNIYYDNTNIILTPWSPTFRLATGEAPTDFSNWYTITDTVRQIF